jgi:RNA methyltransferase, TrmH family
MQMGSHATSITLFFASIMMMMMMMGVLSRIPTVLALTPTHRSLINTAPTRLRMSQSTSDLITSTKSNTVKKIQALLSKRKNRIEAQQTVVEGPRMIFDLLKNEGTRSLVQQVVVSIDRPEWVEELVETYGSDLFVCQGTPEVLAACSDTVTPQGIVATVSIPLDPSMDTPPRSNQISPLFLVLDGVSDPGNLGTLLRSSVATGVAGVLLLPQCCDAWNPKAVRSAMGCSFQIPMLQVESMAQAQQVLANWQVKDIFAATMEDGAVSFPHYDVDWTQHPTAMVIGSEGTGLSDAVRGMVVSGEIKSVHVPMESGIESLNAAVCGSVILFEYLRQCRTMSSKV